MAWCCLQFCSRRAFLILLGGVFLLDLLASLTILLLAKSSSSESRDHSLYDANAVDSLVMSTLRIAVFPLLAALALKLYRRTAAASPLHRLSQEATLDVPPTSPAGGNGLDIPLCDAAAPGAAVESVAPSTATAESSASATTSKDTVFEMQRDHALIMKTASRRRIVIMSVAYLVATAMSFYNGLKCVSFHYDPKLVFPQGALFGLILLCINVEYFTILDYLDKLTEEKGEKIPHLHMHPLFFELGLKCHVCDICHEAMKPPHYIAYRCRTCDFDLCPRCHKKKDNPTAKGHGARSVRRDGEQLTTWTYFKRILLLTADFKNTSALAIGCLIMTQSMLIWAPNVQGSVFDGIIQSLQDGGRSKFERAMIMYLIIQTLQGLFGSLKAYAQELVMRQLACSVRAKLFESVIRMDISFFDTMHTGQITSRLTNDASQMVQPLNTLLNDLLANLMLLVGGMLMAFRTSWKLSILALTVVPPITFSYRKYAQWARSVNRSIYCAMGEANSTATETIHNIRTVRAFSTEQHETDNYQDSNGTALAHGKRSAYVGASVNAFSSYLNNGTALLILWYGGSLVCDSRGQVMSLGSLITFQLYWNMMNSAFISLGNVFNDLIRSSSAAERVISLIDARPELDPDAGAVVAASDVRGHLQLEGVEFRYKTRAEKLVLNSIDLEMVSGSVTALVGKSGGGKSTLVHLLMRFYEPTGGRILLDGRDMRHLSSRSVRMCCGFVAQDTQLFAKSIEENLAYGLGRPHTREEVVAACMAANAHDFIMETEEQYETRVGERGMLLSGGQRQRLAIARCFLRRPRLLFLDEATSALDAENEAVVQQSLDSLIEQIGCTVVLIAHRLSTVIDAQQIAVVHKGGIVERGSHTELLAAGGIYAQLVQRQLSRSADAVMEKQSVSKAAGTKLQTEIDELMEEMESSGKMGA